ncbi:MAG: hypothetical protein K6A92_11635 [Lachnospiraceae bacterium]|nr:hypothetical protein [Lachnospiraceae bacterium]
MKLPNEDPDYENDLGSSISMAGMLTIVILFIILIFALTVYVNRNTLFKKKQVQDPAVTATVTQKEESIQTDPSGKTAQDLDFWDMYPEVEETTQEPTEEVITSAPEKKDPSTDGQHTKVTYADGSEEWVAINNYLSKNSYDFTKLVLEGVVMKYYEDGRKTSYMGVDVSKYQDYVDFNALKKAGVEFVMVRLGARGYESGVLSLDDYFTENMKRASDAGLSVGVYFYSQAINEEEAEEEARMVLDQLHSYNIQYPVAYVMEYIDNDHSRIEDLSRSEKTTIARTFLSAVRDAGYNVMLYGSKQWLIKEIDLSRLTEFDTWLSQSEDIPDYPYRFSMWQYTKKAKIDGIAGDADLNISFIDYTAK